MTVIAEFLRLRDKEKRAPRAMRLMAYPASPHGQRTMDIFFGNIDHMTIQAEFFFWKYQRICPSLVTRLAHLGSIRAVLGKFPFGDSGLLTFLNFDYYFVRVRHTIEKKTQRFITAPRVTT
jgi:hypothetical protein